MVSYGFLWHPMATYGFLWSLGREWPRVGVFVDPQQWLYGKEG